MVEIKKRGRLPRLTVEDCLDMMELWKTDKKVTIHNVAHLWRVSWPTANRVLNGEYIPLDRRDQKVTWAEYGKKRGKKTETAQTT
jgi:hypothetical protein